MSISREHAALDAICALLCDEQGQKRLIAAILDDRSEVTLHSHVMGEMQRMAKVSGGNLPLYQPGYVAGLKAENERMKEALERWLHAHDHYLAGRFPRRCVACARLAKFVSSLNEGKP